MKYVFSRIEARGCPELGGEINCITELVIGLTGTSDAGLSAYRDTLVSLPKAGEEGHVSYEDADEKWALGGAEATAEKNGWKDSIEKECEAAKSKPIMLPLKFQVKAAEDAKKEKE